MRRALCISIAVTGRKSPGAEAESADPKGQDPRAPPRPRAGRAPGQLAIATVMWPVGSQPTNSTGLTLALTLTTPTQALAALYPAALLRRRTVGEQREGACARRAHVDTRAVFEALVNMACGSGEPTGASQG